MKLSAMDKAMDRLERAKRALDALESAQSFKATQAAWADLLTASGTFYSTLEQGAKGCPKSEYWFGLKKHKRRKDPLLKYVHHARNAEEHGIEPVTGISFGGVAIDGDFAIKGGTIVLTQEVDSAIGPNGEVTPRISLNVENNLNIEDRPGGRPHAVKVIHPHVHLVRVRDDLHKDTFDPPREHLGKPLTDPSPVGVAKHLVAYLAECLAEAAKLPQRI